MKPFCGITSTGQSDLVCAIIRAASMATGVPEDKITLDASPDPKMGDYALACFQFAKSLKKAPQEIAIDLAARLQLPDMFEAPQPVGPYLNFRLKQLPFIRFILEEIVRQGKDFGCSSQGEGKTICIDYSAPNIAKHLAVHHIRSTMIGNSLVKIFQCLGYKVVGINHLGDWGTHFGKLITAYKRWADGETLDEAPIRKLNELLVRFTKAAQEDPSLEEEARAWFKKLEDNNEEAMRLWRLFRDLSVKEFAHTYERLGVQFDHETGESFFNDKMDAVIARAEEAGILKESEGALVVEVAEGVPPCLLKKSDGATLYATRDLAAAIYRWETFEFDQCLYVVDSGQSLHFKQFFTVLERMGCQWRDRLAHVPFGVILMKRADGTWGKGRTRTGEVVLLNDVLDEAVFRMHKVARENNVQDPDLVAARVGIGAVIFNDLSTFRTRDVHFDWETMLNPRGETAPYVQYTHARIASVMDKFGPFEIAMGLPYLDLLTLPQEFALAKRLLGFPAAVQSAGSEYDPSAIAGYVIDVCRNFSAWYDLGRKDPAARIISQNRELALARLTLAACTQQVVAASLRLLGIEPLDRM